MADVVLAEYSGQAWLVGGEQHIDDLLANTLPPHVSIEVVACESKSAVDALWRAHGGDDDVSTMWLIHPGVLNRSKGLAGRLSVQFGEWSASLDAQAEGALRMAADMLGREPAAVLALVRHALAEAPAMAGEMANLRTGLMEARLAALGADPARLVRDIERAETPGQADRIDLHIRRSR